MPNLQMLLKSYSSSSLGRHIRTIHGQKYQCPYCLKNHKTCIFKEKYILKIFIDNLKKIISSYSLTIPLHKPINVPSIFIERTNYYICPKLKLGQCHYSKVFFEIDKKTHMETAIKIPKKSSKLSDYQNEANILKILEKPNFYPKVFNSNNSNILEDLQITLFGPTLFDLYIFYGKFDKKTILNIWDNLLHKIKFLSDHNIIHRDIKLENITWSLINNSKIINKDELYIIDYGLNIDLTSLNKNKILKKTIEDVELQSTCL